MLSDFFFQIANLKNIRRSGWKTKLQLSHSESVADHTYMMTVMTMILSDIKNLDTEKIIKMTLLHDWAESKTGDFMPDEIEPERKNQLEEDAMNEILGMLPHDVQLSYQIIWKEYQNNESMEAVFVHQLDKLEMVLQAKIYEKDVKPEEIQPFIVSAVDQIKDNDLKKILQVILE